MTATEAGHTQRDREVRRVLWIEGAANAIALAVKLVVGITTGSFAILADAVHSVADIGNNVIALVVIRYASKPPDRNHPYGHRKFETLAVFVLATLLTVLAVEIVLAAFRAEQHEVTDSTAGLIVMLGMIAFHLGVSTWEQRRARALRSELLEADAKHTFSDALVMLAVVAGWQLCAHGYVWADKAMTIGVALLVAKFAIDLFRRVVPVLVDGHAHDPDSIRDAAAAVQGVIDVSTVRSRSTGLDSAIDVVVTVDADLPLAHAHDIADAVEDALTEVFPAAFVNVHVEPAD